MGSLLQRGSKDPKGKVYASETGWIHLAQAIENNQWLTRFSFPHVRTDAARANSIPQSNGMRVRGDLGLFLGNRQRSQVKANARDRRWEHKPGTAKELEVFLQTMLSPKGVLQHRKITK